MPTVAGIPGPYRFFFYSFDCAESRHIHVERDGATSKWWFDPVTLAGNHGMRDRELANVRGIIFENRGKIIGAWNEHCGQ